MGLRHFIMCFALRFTKDGFDNLVADTWNNLSIIETNKISLLRKKFQALKAIIKNWSRDEMLKASAVRHSAQISLLKDIHYLDKRHSSDLAQKAKIQWVIEDLISDVQTAFISKRQILDGPFILNELISWCKYHKIKAMIFNADFEKAFDSVRWDYLDGVLNNFGFGVKWRGWIQACLSLAMGSILVNGSPSSEFKFHKGLKHGDPLSPFLFILVMESLHISFNNILNYGLYKGIRIDESLTLSHLFYTDDAVFIGFNMG
ncbi:RNA-directed DNA polymerase, eukaryota [Tanacetum coccineum]